MWPHSEELLSSRRPRLHKPWRKEGLPLTYEVRSLLIAEYASVDREGRATIAGAFRSVKVTRFPVFFAPRIFAEITQVAGHEPATIEIHFGGTSLDAPPDPVKIAVPPEPEAPSVYVVAQGLLQLVREGALEVTVVVNGDVLAVQRVQVDASPASRGE